MMRRRPVVDGRGGRHARIRNRRRRRIREAIERGEFDRLPGAGQPPKLAEDAMIPPELRVAYKILKNAGCLPREVELRKEIVTLRDLLRAAEDDGERRTKIRELNHKLLELSLMSGRTVDLDGFPEYRDRIVARLTP